jgi:hypothetical protein
MRRPTVALAVAALLAGACSSGAANAGPRFSASVAPPASSPTSSATPGPTTGAPGAPGGAADCPASYAEPDPHRPDIRLVFDLSEDMLTVTGTEHVEFIPDLPIREVVFRLTANTAPSAERGNSITVSAATASPGGQQFRVDRAGAGQDTQGGLLVVPLSQEVPAGQRVTADVAFTLRLGEQSFDRFGKVGRYAWWGSGQPLLAWERGFGWHTEPLLRFIGESATSEAARIDLTVTAPSRLTVLASGTPDPPADAGNGRRRWHALADRARDVSLAVGDYTVKEQTVDGTRVVVGTPAGRAPDELLSDHVAAVRQLAGRFGPFPFPVLTVARLPIEGGGIEYPGSILMLGDSRLISVHETAHQWFYAMVGDSQARDPWLDEAFATYAEQQVNNDGDPAALDLPGRVGQSMQDFGDRQGGYYGTVYAKGAAALAAARTAAGPAKFDAALRCYINANAWRIARPADLAKALAALPAAIDVLRRAGALP